MNRAAVYAFFVLSGASALAYEIVWTRQLTLVAGATTPAVSVVLAVFMAGLALGARLFGGVADRTRSALRWYAALELGIGVYGLAQPTLLEWTSAGYLRLLPGTADHGPALLALRLGLAVLLLLAPATLMGGTLPLLVRFVARSPERFGRSLGTLYAANLAGAVLGSALTGFVLIRTLGLHGTIAAAVLVNLAIGLFALLLAGRERSADAVPSVIAPAAADPRAPLSSSRRRALFAVVALSGFLTMGYEVAWTRVLVFSFGSTIYAFTLILVVFLLGLALGSMLFAALDRRVDGVELLVGTQLAAAASALALTPVAARLPEGIAALSLRMGYSGEAQLLGMILGSLVVMLPAATAMGVVFPLGSRMLVSDLEAAGQAVGRAYGANTVGSILGSLLTGFVLLPLLSLKGSLLALACVQTAAAFALLPWTPASRAARLRLAGVGGALVVAAAVFFVARLPGPNPFDRMDYGQAHPPAVLAHHDDVTATVTVAALEDGARTLRINGFEAAAESGASGAGYMPMMSHLPLLLAKEPRRVLVICVGTGSTAGSVLLHPGVSVEAVDINRSVLAFAPLFSRTNRGLHEDPRARLVLDDGRNYLVRTQETYDVVTSEPMPPTHAGVVNLYTREYYELARRRLRSGGVLVQWLPFHLVTFAETRQILRTVQDVFPETTLWVHGGTGLVVARHEEPIVFDATRVRAAYEERALAHDLARLGVATPAALYSLFAMGPASVRAFTQGAPAITDDRPSLEFHPPRNRITPSLGLYTADEARALLAAYDRRAEELPTAGATEAEAAILRAGRRAHNAIERGNVWLSLGRTAEAAADFEAGLAPDTRAADRGTLLYGLALAAQARGDAAASLQYVERSLHEHPTNARARQFRDTLRPHAD